MTLSSSPPTENQFSNGLNDTSSVLQNKDIIPEHVEEENEEDEEGDMDFNPFLKEALSLEASSSLSSEIEEFDADVVDSTENHSPVANDTNAPTAFQNDSIRNIEPTNDITTFTDVNGDVTGDDEDAIWRRTRARYSLVGSTLDELETFLQETDDEDDLHHNIDDEEEYRKFLAAVLNNGDASSCAEHETDTLDEDEDNDADFELELEEALESDVDETLHNASEQRERARGGRRRPETRQKKRQKTDSRHEFSGHANRPLRPILPYPPIAPNVQNTSFVNNNNNNNSMNHVWAFTPHQIGQLHCLMYEHVQLLVQLFSLSVLEPSKQHIATQVSNMLSEMMHKRDQVLASQRVPYPGFCFSLPYIWSAITVSSGSHPTDGSFWVPFVNDNVRSVMDVAPLNLVQSYMDDINIAVRDHQQRQLEFGYDATVDKECLFPFNSLQSSDPTVGPDKASDPKSKKSIAAALIERSKNQSIALVPKDVAKLALRFFPLFNPALFPHKPPPSTVANRVLFTDAEDGLLARGLMRFNTDWKEIQKNFLPCKTPHQIFVRQKNCACSRAPENPIKAVRRMKTSPLTPQEKALIEEGLKIYKLDWTAVWQYMVPHRDPSILPRQYRTAVGDQKSYKGDEHTKAKRRLYESQKRMSKLGGSRSQTTAVGQNGQQWSNTDEANPLSNFPTNCGTDNNSGDDGGNNEDEAYVHEAFLADWRPVSSGENPQAELFTPNQLTNFPPHNIENNGSFNQVPVKFLRPEVNIQPYRARKANCSRVVKLAPDLPPVNLPPTVRIMSQSAFSKFQGEASKVRQNVVISQPRFGQDNAGEKGDSDLQLHPLLFEGHDDASLPYYPLTGSASSSSSFDFFPNNPLNLNLFRYPNQGKGTTVNFFNNNLKPSELSSSFTGVDFHPLLQRSDDGSTNPTGVNIVLPRSPNELDLDIRLSSSVRNENDATGREPGGSHVLAEDNGTGSDLGPGSVGGRHDEIVMEQEELSDSEDDDDVAESVEFECEEMTDTEGETGSDSDHVENAQDDSLAKVMVHGDDSDEDEPRCQEAATSREPTSLFGLRLNPKLPVTRRSSKKTTLPHQQLDAAAQAKKPRKRPQKPDPR